MKICDECETVAHCTKHGCIPKVSAKDAMKLGLEALEDFEDAIRYDNEQHDIGARVCCDVLSYNPHTKDCKALKAITALRAALAEQPAPVQQEPDAIGCKCSECGAWQRWTPSGMVCKNGHGGVPGVNHRLYTSPPARKPLTDEQIDQMWSDAHNDTSALSLVKVFARSIEAAHGIKENT